MRERVYFGILDEYNQAKSLRVWDPECRDSILSLVWASEVFVLVTQIPLLVSMDTVGLSDIRLVAMVPDSGGPEQAVHS